MKANPITVTDEYLPLCKDICSVVVVPAYHSVQNANGGWYEKQWGYNVLARVPYVFGNESGFDEYVYTQDLDSNHPHTFATEKRARQFANTVTVDGEIRERQWRLLGTTVLYSDPTPQIK